MPEEPELASMLRAGTAADAAVDVGNGVFLSAGISNSYLVTSPGGDLLINTGLPGEDETHQRRFAQVSANPLRAIVFTQSHIDHIGGWETFAKPDVATIVQQNFDDVREYWSRLGTFYATRALRIWVPQNLPQRSGPPRPVAEPVPTVRFEHAHQFTVGDRRVELLSTPGGETTDSLVVWLPADRVVFTGNLFGPIFGHVPNLYTIRGDKIRSALTYIRCVEKVRDLEPEVLITGHGEPIRGAANIARDLTRMRDAVHYLRDATFEGMNAGTDLLTLMREITLPPALDLGQGHGKVSWNVRAIWEEYAGWFRFSATTELYAVPQSTVWPELVAMAGGAPALVAAAVEHIDAGEPLEALHLLEIAASAPADEAARVAKRRALEQLLADSGRENLSETRWLEAELAQLA